MSYLVEEHVVKAADRCPRKHECLALSNGKLCRILATRENGTDDVFVQCQQSKPCPYQESQDERLACRCPVRLRIYQRYGR